jgi:hypothetical protein
MTEKSWFTLRYNHFPPNTFIKLGQLVSDPTEPHIPIDFSGPSAFPPEMPVVPSKEEAFHWDKTSGSDGHAKLSAEMDGLPVTGTVKAEFKKTVHDWAKFKTLDTQLIVPTPQYVDDSMARPAVKKELGKRVLLKSVFMITGLKIAREGKRGQESTRKVEGGMKAGVTPMPSFPMSLGPDVGGGVNSSEEVKSKATDFVWAFSLRQVYYRMGKVVKAKTYDHGATLEDRSDEDESSDEETEEAVDPSTLEIRVDGLDPDTFTGEGSRLVSITEKHADDNGEVFLTAEKM